MILRLDSEKLAETWIFGQKWQFFDQQVRLAMVPRDSQQRPQLYEQLT